MDSLLRLFVAVKAAGRSLPQWVITTVTGGLICLPLCLSAWFICTFGVDVPTYDQWHCVYILRDLYEGKTSYPEIFLTSHAGHLIGMPFLLMALLAPHTGYDIRAELIAGLAVVFVASSALMQMARERTPKGSWSLAALAPVVWLACSLRQIDSLLGGCLGGLEHMAVSSLFVVTICLLDHVKRVGWRLLFAMASAVCCCFTLGNGILLLPLGALQLGLVNGGARKGGLRTKAGAALVVWTVFSVALACLICLRKRAFVSRMWEFIEHHIREAVQFQLAVIGSPLCRNDDSTAAVVVGLILFALAAIFVYLVARKREALRRSMAAPAMLVIYAAISALLITATRAHNGVSYAMTSRYASVTYVGIAGLYLLFLSARELPGAWRKALLGTMIVLIGAGAVVTTADGPKWALIRHDRHLKEANVVRTYRLQQESKAQALYPSLNPRRLRNLTPFLEKYHLSVFREQLPEKLWMPDPAPIVHVDGAGFAGGNGKYLITIDRSKGWDFSISGWAVDRKSRGPVGGMVLCIDDKIETPMAYGLDRSDAASALRKASYRKSGFWTSFGSSILGEGPHVLTFKILSPDRQSYYRVPEKVVLNAVASL